MIGEPWLGREPRAWQREAVPVALEGLRSRRPRVIQACTGAGKSIAQAEVVAEILASPRLTAADVVVVTVPTEALVEQLAATVEARLPGLVGRWYGRRKESGRVIVTCVPSLGTLAADLQIRGLRCVAWLADECHRGLASEDRQRWIGDLAPLTRIGWTATPWRTETPIPGWEAPLAYRYGLADAVRDGVCILPTVHHYDGPEADVTDATIRMLDAIRPEGPGIVSALSVADAEDTAFALTASGWPALEIHSRIPRDEVLRRVEALRTGELRALVHVRLLVEGVDLPWLRWLALRAPRTTLGLVQEVGRVLRVDEGKVGAIVLDPLAQSPIAAFSTPEALGEVEQAAAAEASGDVDETDEGPPVTVIPRAVALVELDRWIAGLVAAAYRAGVRIRAATGSRDWRSELPTATQAERLAQLGAKSHGPISRLPAGCRAGVRAIAEDPSLLSRGGAADLLSVLYGISGLVGESARAQGDVIDWSRVWRWPDEVDVAPLDVATVRAARGVGGAA